MHIPSTITPMDEQAHANMASDIQEDMYEDYCEEGCREYDDGEYVEEEQVPLTEEEKELLFQRDYIKKTTERHSNLPAVERYISQWRYIGDDPTVGCPAPEAVYKYTTQDALFKRNERSWRIRHCLEANLAILAKYGEEALAKPPRRLSVDLEDSEDDDEADKYWKTSDKRNIQNKASNVQGFLDIAASSIRWHDDRQDHANELQDARDKFCGNHISLYENKIRPCGDFSATTEYAWFYDGLAMRLRRNQFAYEHNVALVSDGSEFMGLKEIYEGMLKNV
jgi:hypothetical protein